MFQPCNNSIATSCVDSLKTSSSDEGRLTAPFREGVSSSAERELAIDMNGSTVSSGALCLICLWVCKKGKNVRDLLGLLSVEKSASRRQFLESEADDDNSFDDIMSGIRAVGDAESKVWTFAEALARGKS